MGQQRVLAELPKRTNVRVDRVVVLNEQLLLLDQVLARELLVGLAASSDTEARHPTIAAHTEITTMARGIHTWTTSWSARRSRLASGLALGAAGSSDVPGPSGVAGFSGSEDMAA